MTTAMVCVATLSACGTSNPDAHHTTGFVGSTIKPSYATDQPTTSPVPFISVYPSPSPSPSPILDTKAVISNLSTNDTKYEYVFVGKLQYATTATPPDDAFNACKVDSAEEQASAFAPVEIAIKYSGTFQESVTLGSPIGDFGRNVFTNLGLPANLVLDVGSSGSLVCDIASNAQPGAISVDLVPNGQVVLNGWILLPGALTNANPTLSTEQLNEFAIAGLGLPYGDAGETLTGPGVATCNSQQYVLPFATIPFTDSNGSCSAG